MVVMAKMTVDYVIKISNNNTSSIYKTFKDKENASAAHQTVENCEIVKLNSGDDVGVMLIKSKYVQTKCLHIKKGCSCNSAQACQVT